MDPRELKTESQWREILRGLVQETGMAATLTDAAGNILFEEGDRFELCRRLREDEQARTFVCSQTNSAMLAMVKRSLQPVVDECDAGLLRIAVPVARDGVLVGQVVACGLRGDEVDTFLVAKQTGLSEEDVATLAERSLPGDVTELEEVAGKIAARIA